MAKQLQVVLLAQLQLVESISSNVNPTAITQSTTTANPVVITTTADLEIKDGSAITITGVATQTQLNDNVFYVKQDPSGTAKRDFILMDEVDGTRLMVLVIQVMVLVVL